MPLQHLEEFKRRLEDYVARTIRPQQLQPTINVEQEISFEIGKDNVHLHLDLTDTRLAMEGIAFNKGDWAPYIQNGNPVDVCYTIEENTYNNRTTLQMRVLDLKETSSSKDNPV